MFYILNYYSYFFHINILYALIKNHNTKKIIIDNNNNNEKITKLLTYMSQQMFCA